MQPSLDSFVGNSQAQQGGQPSLDSFVGQSSSVAQSNQPQQSLSDKIWGGLASGVKAFGSVTGANAIGESLGTAAYDTGQIVQGKNPFTGPNANESQVDIPKTIGGYGQAALTIASPEIGTGGTALGRIAANTALGAGLGGTGVLANKGSNASVGDVATGAGTGALLGGAISAGTEGISSLVQNLPKWFTKAALPKLDSNNVDYALQNTKLGSIKSLVSDSKDAIQSYEGQVQSILSHPEFKTVAEDTQPIIDGALKQFPNSGYQASDLYDNARSIAPEVKSLIDKMEAGQADLQEMNTIRKSLDQATKSVYTSINRPPETKALGAALSGAIRDYVQTEAPNTAPVFADYSKELGLNKALVAAQKKVESGASVGLYDILSGTAGFIGSGGNPLGAAGAVAAEKALRSPTVQLGAAKGIQALQGAAPVANALVQGAKAPIIGAATRN